MLQIKTKGTCELFTYLNIHTQQDWLQENIRSIWHYKNKWLVSCKITVNPQSLKGESEVPFT